MGPLAVPKEHLPKVLQVQTFVNGEKRQDSNSDELIFSMSKLISTISEGQTIQAGDVIATGTPAGVGLGMKPPQYLQPGDVVEVRITGLGTLTNRVASTQAANYTSQTQPSYLPTHNSEPTNGGFGLRKVNNKLLHIVEIGPDNGEPMVYIHGLGANSEYWRPLVSSMPFTYRNIIFDLEGCGFSPTSAASVVSISSYAADVASVFTSPGILIAHGIGCAAAILFALRHPELVTRLILLGPPLKPLPSASSQSFIG